MAERPCPWPKGWGAPRLLTRGQLRAYLQITDEELAERIERGQLPGPLWGCAADLPPARWDRHTVDRALDRASAIYSTPAAAEEELDRALGTRRRA